MKKYFVLIISLAAAFCMNACGDDNKENDNKQTCNYEGSKCNPQGTALLTCVSGSESTTPCKCTNNTCENAGVTAQCQYEGSKCNDNGTALLTCKSGVESTKKCECKDGKCQTHSTQTECNYTTPKCNEDNTALLTCEGGTEYSEPCECVVDECIEYDIECDFEGQGCNEAGTALITCSDLRIIESKTCTCNNNKCVEKCIPGSGTGCSEDLRSKEYCDDQGNIKTEACPPDHICNHGECIKNSSGGTCEFTAQCAADLSGIKKCSGGTQTFEPCKNRESCSIDEETELPACVSAMTSSTTCKEELFRPYCDNNTAYTCESNALNEQPCGTKNCVNGECVGKTPDVHINDECKPDGFKQQCAGEIPVDCNKKTKHVEAIDLFGDCSAKGQICGVVTESSVPEASCYDECSPADKGTFINVCIPAAGKLYESKQECVDIGNGRYGYKMVEGSFNPCDLGCKEGHCYDYKTDFPKYGQSCEPLKDSDTCISESMAGICTVDNDDISDTGFIYLVEICDTNEICLEQPEGSLTKAKCYKQCNAGDPAVYSCTLEGMGSYSKKYECKSSGGKQVYIDTDSKICPKGCADSGECKK